MTSPHPNSDCILARGQDFVKEGFLFAQSAKLMRVHVMRDHKAHIIGWEVARGPVPDQGLARAAEGLHVLHLQLR